MNPHKVLGVAPNATPSEIKTAYRKLVKEHHPDRNGGSESSARKFQEVQSAYDMLRADKKPKQQAQDQQGFHQNFHQHGFHFSFDMDQMFNHMREHVGNPSMHAQVEISLEQAFKGCTVDFKIGTQGGAPRDVVVSIPAGIGHGQTVRVKGVAGQPNPNHPPGDLMVTVLVRRHPIFHRLGMTLLTQIDVDLIDMLTGTEVEIPLLEGGTQKLVIMPNSSPDSVYSLVGKGMAVPNSSSRGDLQVKLNPRFRNFTQEQLEVLRSLK
jgi:DnaJ-class molecular chaperone